MSTQADKIKCRIGKFKIGVKLNKSKKQRNFVLPLFSIKLDDEARSEEGREEVGRDDVLGRGERENGIAAVTVSLKSVTLSLPLINTEFPPEEPETEFAIPPKLLVEVEVGKPGRELEEESVGMEVETEVVAGVSLFVAFFTNPKIKKEKQFFCECKINKKV